MISGGSCTEPRFGSRGLPTGISVLGFGSAVFLCSVERVWVRDFIFRTSSCCVSGP
ncbi:hypothetical protein BDV32DRAFT_132449, partial [Aspergillus pseudonomiae]